MTAVTIPAGYEKDAKNRLVPIDTLKQSDILIDDTVFKCLGFAKELSAQIRRLRHGHVCTPETAEILAADPSLPAMMPKPRCRPDSRRPISSEFPDG